MTVAKLYRIGNQVKTLRQWTSIYLKPISTVRERLRRGWDLLDALREPGGQQQATLTVGDETRTLKGWAKHKGIPLRLIKDRRKRGCTPDEQIAPARVDGFEAFGRWQTHRRWAAEKEMARSTLKYRIDVLKMSPELALTLPVAKQGRGRGKNHDQ